MSIHQLIYRSTASRRLADDELGRLIAQARIYNYSQAVTGVLFYAGQQFLQVLEGDPAVVRPLYEHIAHDSRQANVVKLLDASGPERLFPHWSMGFSEVCPAALARLLAYLEPELRAGQLPRGYHAQTVVAGLLREFVASLSAGPQLPICSKPD
ncbi:BLUF domain-containing protein [Hymenobacter sp.]|uniref:BLUF domain-containing protein n=1 Tax=Hymenobacter sp. TaxID=1898978 RepID=UPI00286D25B0|nr:BLUF domain-containing protein [Hymenobacter sp.]